MSSKVRSQSMIGTLTPDLQMFEMLESRLLMSAPSLSNIAVGGIGPDSAVISWNTDQPSTEKVLYGVNAATELSTIEHTSIFSTSTAHAVTIAGLMPNTTYKYEVYSKNVGGEAATSSVLTFTTGQIPAAGTTLPKAGGLTSYPVYMLGDNLLTNAGFENVSGGEPVGWADNGLFADNTAAHTGTYSYNMTDAYLLSQTQSGVQSVNVSAGYYTLSGWIKTSNIAKGNARFFFNGSNTPDPYKDANGNFVNGSKMGLSGTNDWTYMSQSDISVTQSGSLPVSCGEWAALGGTTGTAWFDDVELRQELAPNAQAYMQYPNFNGMLFTDESQTAKFDVKCTPPSGSLSDYTLKTLVVRESNGQTVSTQTLNGPAADQTVSVDGSGFVTGETYLVRFQLVRNSDGVVAYEAPAQRISKVDASYKSSMTVYYDQNNRVILGGQSKFLLGVYDAGGGYSNSTSYWTSQFNDVNRLFELPVNTYLNFQLGQASATSMQAMMSVLQTHGIYYIQTANVANFPGITDDSYVTSLGSQPGFAGWYTADERLASDAPGIFNWDYRLQGLDPDSMTFTVSTRPDEMNAWSDTQNMLAMDPYPLYGKEPANGYPLNLVADWTRATVAAVQGSRPVETVIQDFWFTTQGRFPTKQELLDMSYMAIANGANGLWYWSIGNGAGMAASTDLYSWSADRIKYFQDLQNVTTDVASLQNALSAVDNTTMLTGNSNSNITTRVKYDSTTGLYYVIASNYAGTTQSATFTWNGPLASVAVYTEGRSITPSGGTFTDSFGPYQAHVYVINPSGAKAPVTVNDAYNTTQKNLALTIDAAHGVLANDVDPNGSSLTASLVSGVSHGTLSLNSDGSFTYTPTTNYVGPDAFTYKAFDGTSYTNGTVQLRCNAAVPVSSAKSYQTAQDTQLVVNAANGVLVGATDADGNAITSPLYWNVKHGTLTLNGDGSFTYTPASGYIGQDSFTYRAYDAVNGTYSPAYTVTIAVGNAAPVVTAGSFTVRQSSYKNVTGLLTISDSDQAQNNETLTFAINTNPAHGTITNWNSATGTFTYTPTAGYSGPDSFTYKGYDGTSYGTPATVTITVAADQAPTAVADSYTTRKNVPLSITSPGVLINDTDPENDPLTAVPVANPSHGTLSLNSDGSFTYTPTTNYVGSDSFTYKANDGTLNSAVQTVSINVLNDAAPTANADSYSTNLNTALNIAAAGVLVNDTDPENDALTAILVTNPAHGTVTLNSNGSFTYTPNAGFHGADYFTYKAHDTSLNDSAPAVVSIGVVNTQATENVPNGTFENGSTSWTLYQGNGSVWSVVNSQQHEGSYSLQMTNSDQAQFTPNATGSAFTLAAGTYAFSSWIKTSSLGQASPFKGIKISLQDSSNNIIGTAFAVSGTTAWTFYTTNVTITQSGSYHIRIDSYGKPAGTAWVDQISVSQTVPTSNTAPTAAADPSYVAHLNTPLSVNGASGVLANDSDSNGDGIEAVLNTTTAHGVLALNPDGSYTYTPNSGYYGNDSFTYKAFDGQAYSSAATATIRVNAPPAAANDTFTAQANKQLSVSAPGVLSNDTDPNNDVLTAVKLTNPSNGTVTFNSDGSFTYMPNSGFTGADAFTYKAFDGTDYSSPATVSLNVTGATPLVSDDSYTINKNNTLYIAPDAGVLANDTNPDGGNLTAARQSSPSHGSLILNLDGSFSYTPAAGFTGTDTFTYKAFNGTLYSDNAATVTLVVTNTTPVASNDSYSVGRNHTLTVSAATGVLANDRDSDGDTLTASFNSGVSHGSLTLNSNGSFTYTPTAGYAGPDSFTYKAFDGTAYSSPATVSLNVTNAAPTGNNDSYSASQNGTLTVSAASGVLANDTDADGDTLTAVKQSDPSHGTLTFNSDGSFTYTPTSGYFGPDSFTYKAFDGVAYSNTATVNLTVNQTSAGSYSYDFTGLSSVNAGSGTGTSYVAGQDFNVVAGRATPAMVSGRFKVGTGSVGADWTTETNGQYCDLALVNNFTGAGTYFCQSDGAVANGNRSVLFGAQDKSNYFAVRLHSTLYDGQNNTAMDIVKVVNGVQTKLAWAGVPSNSIGSDDIQVTIAWSPNANNAGSATITVLWQSSDHSVTRLNQTYSNIDLSSVSWTTGCMGLREDAGYAGLVYAKSFSFTSGNHAPVANNDAYSTSRNHALTVNAATGVLANDTDADHDTITAVKQSDPSHGTVTFNSDGSFTYTPTAGYAGSDSFTYKAFDGQAYSTTATVNITISNTAPVANNDAYSVDANNTLTVSAATGVLANDTDADGDTLTAVKQSDPSHGTLTFNSDGSFIYTPTAGYVGADSFTYKAYDGVGYSSVATVSLTVNAGNYAPNGGFESSTSGLPNNWSCYQGGGSVFSDSTSQSHSGSSSLQMSNSDQAPYTASASSDGFTLVAGTYSLSFFAKLAAGFGGHDTLYRGLRISLYASGTNTYIGGSALIYDASGSGQDWTQYSYNVTVATAGSYYIKIDCYGKPDGTAWIDDIRLS